MKRYHNGIGLFYNHGLLANDNNMVCFGHKHRTLVPDPRENRLNIGALYHCATSFLVQANQERPGSVMRDGHGKVPLHTKQSV